MNIRTIQTAMQILLARLYLALARVWNAGQQRLADQSGQSMVEYVVIIALVALVAMAAIQALSGSLTTVLQNIASRLSGLPS